MAEQELMDMKMAQAKVCWTVFNLLFYLNQADYFLELKMYLSILFHIYFTQVCYNPDMANLKPDYINNLTVKLGLINTFLTGPWVAGANMTYVDFLAYEFLDHIRRFVPDSFKEMGNVNSFMNRFEALPGMRKWFDSDVYKAGAYIHGPMAAWNGKD